MGDVANAILCSNGFQKFFEAIQVNFSSEDETMQMIRDSFHYIAEEIPIGKLTAQIAAPQTILEPAGKNSTISVVCCELCEDVPYTETFHTAENGSAVISSYAQKGHLWTDEEKDSLRFLSQIIFLLCGRSRLIRLMQRTSVTDLLTGTYNTRGFMRIGEGLFAKGILCEYTGLFINIKNFNYINQAVGPKGGDGILHDYAQIIQEELLPDEALSRLGGDNFTALVHSERIEDFLRFMSNIKITVPYNESVRTFDICAKIGICKAEKEQTMGELMNAMASAIHTAKSSGQKDYVWFQPQMLSNALHDKEISILFPKALQNHEFVVYYQPKVTLANNQLCGCEALVRWIRNGEIVSPMEFIPVLEHEGSICKLDFYMLELVCKDIQKWLASGIEPVRVSVNFSKVHLHNENLANDIIAVLQKYQIDSKYIEVELTEMSGYENYETLFDFVQAMKHNGVSTSIDDFGTGYSSLNLLKDLNVDVIKLDKSFLNNVENHNRTDEIVIKNIVNMVNELNMEVIAEGVETPFQAEFLRNVNCCMAQGFLFDRPLPHDEFEKRLSNRHTYVLASEPSA